MKTIKLLITFCLLLSGSMGIAQDLEIYVSSTAENAIKQYEEDGTFVRNIVTANSGGLVGPQDIIFLSDGTMIVSGIQNTAIKQYNSTSGDYIGNFTSGYSLNQPTRMRIRNNLLYVIQWGAGDNKVVRFDLDGNFVDEFSSIGILQSIGIDWDAVGNMYISSFGQGPNGFVQKFDTSGNDMGTFIDSTILQGPTDIWFDENENLLVEDWTLGIVRRFSPTGQYIDDLITGMSNPEGVSFFPNGDILICDWGTDTVERFDNGGNPLGTLINNGNGIADPNAVVIRDPNLSVPDYRQDQVFVIPTIGTEFHFNAGVASNFQEFVLYDISGRMIQKLDPAVTPVWEANNLGEGIYFIVALGQIYKATQKIIIKK